MFISQKKYACISGVDDMKGQYFFIGSVILMILILGFATTQKTMKEELFHILYIKDRKFINIINELNFAAHVSLLNNANHTINFSKFLRYHENIKIFFLIIDKTHNKTVVGNFFKTRLNVSINEYNILLNDGETYIISYTERLNLTYCFKRICNTRNIKGSRTAFFHVILNKEDIVYDDKWEYEVIS